LIGVTPHVLRQRIQIVHATGKGCYQLPLREPWGSASAMHVRPSSHGDTLESRGGARPHILTQMARSLARDAHTWTKRSWDRTILCFWHQKRLS
jgi:hypothetical protein